MTPSVSSSSMVLLLAEKKNSRSSSAFWLSSCRKSRTLAISRSGARASRDRQFVIYCGSFNFTIPLRPGYAHEFAECEVSVARELGKKVLYSRNFTFSHGGDGDDVRCSKSDGVGETGDSGHVEDTHRRRGGGMISRCRGLGGIPT